MESSTKIVYVIAGPTAVGKTSVAISLTKKLQTSIVSADSRQCYKEMTIGTAKPTPGELNEIKHYFIDEFPVTQSLTAADYEKLALDYLDKIFIHSDYAVVCGGTGLYIKALCEGIDAMPAIDSKIAEAVNAEYQSKGIEWLQDTTKEEDREFYERGEIQNPARLIRALVFIRSTGESILSYRTGIHKKRPFKIIKIGLELPRTQLYKRINIRVDEMMQQGLLEEVKAIYPLKHLKNLQTVGYSELFDYLDNKMSLDETVEKIKQHTRNYAKRQLTWFKKDRNMNWFAADDKNLLNSILAIK